MAVHSFFGATLPTANTITPNSSGRNFTGASLFFRVTKTCWVTQIKWRRPDTTAISGTIRGKVSRFRSVSSTDPSVTGTFTVGSTAGWKTAGVPPMRLVVGRWYEVEVIGSIPRLASTSNYFSTGPARNGLVSGPLEAPNKAGSPYDNLQRRNPDGTTIRYQGFTNNGILRNDDPLADNYWVDLVVDDAYVEPPVQLASDMFTTILQH